MTIWEEFFNPQPIKPFSVLRNDFNAAWEWIFEKEDGEFVRAGVTLNVIRMHSLALRKQGVKDSCAVAAVAIWNRFKETKIKIPTRK